MVTRHVSVSAPFCLCYFLSLSHFISSYSLSLSLCSGFGKSPASESVKSEQSRVDLLKHFLEALGVRAPVLITPSMSGHYALPFLQRFSHQLRAFVPIAPVATRTLTPQQYHDIQVCVKEAH